MAGDWIKMRTNLRTHPKVVRIASALRTDKLCVVGGLHAVWSIFDEHSVDGQLHGYTLSALDSEVGLPGFSELLIGVEWLVSDGNDGLSLPEFDTHNGASAKRRAQEAERKRAERAASKNHPHDDRKASASDADKKRTREEKNRDSSSSLRSEEQKPRKRGAGADAPTVSIDQLVAEGIDAQHAKDWMTVRKTKKLPLTRTAWDEVKTEATKAGMTAAQAVHKAVSEGWGGFKAKWLVAEAAKDAKAGVPTANWWDTRSGMLSKGVELGVTPPAKAEFGDGMDTADWIRFQAHVWVKAGDGPWWNEREEPVWRMAKRLRDGGSTDLGALAIAAIRKEPAHA